MHHHRIALIIGLAVFLPAVAQAQLLIKNGLSTEADVAPGQSYTGVVAIWNTGNRNERVHLYQTDYLFFADGSNHFGEPGSTARSNAGWLRLNQEEVTIAPGVTREVEFIVTVPADASLTGTYWSLVMVESITQSILNPDTSGEDELGVVSGVRFAVQVITNIGDTGARSLVFSNPSLDSGGEEPILAIDVENPGERGIVPDFYAEVYSNQGRYLGHFEGPRKRFYPGTSARIPIPLPGVGNGDYQVQVVADAGGNDLFGAVYGLSLGQ